MREVLIGDLAYVQLATVLQIMENEQLSGWVQTRIGTVVIRGGLIVDVDVDGLPHVDGMMRLVDQEHGGFIVEAGTPPRQEPIGTVPAMLMQAARLKDEWERVRGLVLKVEGELPEPIETVAGWLDGRRRLEDAVKLAALHLSQVVDPVSDALTAGSLKLARRDAGPAESSNTPAPRLALAGSDSD